MKLFKKESYKPKDNSEKIKYHYEKLIELLSDPSDANKEIAEEIFKHIIEMFCFQYFHNYYHYTEKELRSWIIGSFERAYEKAQFIKEAKDLHGYKIVKK